MYKAHYQTADGNEPTINIVILRRLCDKKKKLFIFVYVVFFFCNLKTKILRFFYMKFYCTTMF